MKEIIKFINLLLIYLPRYIFYRENWIYLNKKLESQELILDTNYTYRLATKDDIDNLVSNYPYEFSWFLSTKRITNRINKRFFQSIPCFIALNSSNKIVGMLWCNPININNFPSTQYMPADSKAFELTNLFVKKETRRDGVAKNLLLFSEQYMLKLKYDYAISHVFKRRVASIQFHLRSRFKIIGTKSHIKVLGKNVIKYTPDFDLNLITPKKFPPVIIVGRANPNMLAHARSLGSKKIKIYSILMRKDPTIICRTSRYIYKVINLANQTNKYEQLVDEIIKIAKNELLKPTLFVTNEQDITNLEGLMNNFSDKVNIISNPISLSSLVTKTAQNIIAEDSDVPVPKSVTLTSENFSNELLTDLPFPIICRPTTADSAGGFTEKFTVYDNIDLAYESLTLIFTDKSTELLCQEYIPGDDSTLYFAEICLGHNGEIYSQVTGHKVRQFPKGLTSKGQSSINETIVNHSNKIMAHITQPGLYGIEFKQDEKTNKFYFIEINLRADNFISIAKTANVDLILHSYLIANKLDNFVIPWKQSSAQWFDLVADSMAILTLPSSIKLKSSQILNNLINLKSDCALTLKDPLPGIIWHSNRTFSGIIQAFNNRKNNV
jgi:predicted ATP-grasp superfamily ATP-dependent carboligase/ribosomal protein S18 acetylase RimI-like enzyme